jgi:hypothetical protein
MQQVGTKDTKKTHDVRGELRDDDEALYLMDHPDSDEEIPTLDIAPYLQGAPGGLQAAAARLRDISRRVGFFYLKGHGIPQPLIDGVFEQSRRFHALPIEAKTKIPYSPPAASAPAISRASRTNISAPTSTSSPTPSRTWSPSSPSIARAARAGFP